MSYILEALKKSEERRRQEQAASQPRHFQPKPSAAAGGGRPLLPIVCVIALFCAVGAGLAFFSFRSGAVPSTVPEMNGMAAEQSARRLPPASAEQEAIPVLEAGAAKTTPPEPAQKSEETVFEPGPLAAENLQTTTPETASELAAARIPALEEFDDAFVQSVPRFTMAGHVYSEDPELRMILINNRVVREKDIVEKDYIVDEITPDGLIMRLGEIRFRLPAK